MPNINTINGYVLQDARVDNLQLSNLSCYYEVPRWLRFDPSNKKGLIIKAGTSIKLANGTYKSYTTDTKVNLSSYVTQAGKDYFVYLANDGTITAYTSYQTNKGVKIGRFHTLCVASGAMSMTIAASPSSGIAAGSTYLVKSYSQEIDPDFYNFYNKSVSSVTVQSAYDVITCTHPLSGFAAGDILPESIFCLSWYPHTKYEDGMVYDVDTDKVIDIYLQSGTGFNTRSAYNATHTVSRTPLNHREDMRMVGKRLLDDITFTSAAIGSNEKTNITGSSDKTTVGGHVDTSNRRMVSAIGCEEMCGYLFQWLDEVGPAGIYGGNDASDNGWQTTDSHASFGLEYCQPYVLRAGSDWDNGSHCGSRARAGYDSRSSVLAYCGGRGLSHISKGV